MRTRRPVLATLAAAVAAALLAAGCAGEAERVTLPPEAGGAPLLYVAVGTSVANERLAPQEAWPQLLYRKALPRQAAFVNLGSAGATAASTRASVGEATALSPDLATVWLGPADALGGVAPEDYEADLSAVVRSLRRGGAARVLVATTPPLDGLPGYLACVRPGARPRTSSCSLPAPPPPPERLVALVDAYGAAVRRVAEAEGAAVVDLAPVVADARARGAEASLVGADGLSLSAEANRAVADAFAAVVDA